jgi:L-threonylcarbamoyladenylate synthase
MKKSDIFDDELVRTLLGGGVAVIKTDTLYGIVASAYGKASVQRIYQLKHRNPEKACIILIGDESQIITGTMWTRAHSDMAAKYWPGPVSIIAPVSDEFPDYLSRAETSIAYRLPGSDALRSLLRKTGPLIAPSANPEGRPPAKTIEQARQYFGEHVDRYVDNGPCTVTEPSRLITLDEAGAELRLR